MIFLMQVSITTKGEVADRGAAARPEPPIRREHPNPERVEAIPRRVAMAIVGQKRTQNGVNQTQHAGPAPCKMLLGFTLRLMTDAKFDTASAVHVVRVRAMYPASGLRSSIGEHPVPLPVVQGHVGLAASAPIRLDERLLHMPVQEQGDGKLRDLPQKVLFGVR